MTQVGGVNATFAVKDLGGDRAAAYSAPGTGLYDVFDRLPAAYPRQDTTVWIDFEIASEVCSLELWSDGAYSWNAGTGLIFQVEGGGTMRLFERWGNSVPVFPGPAAPASGRVRLRLVHERLGGATLHADSFDGAAWQLDAARWTLADDRLYPGLSTALGDYLGAARAVRRVTIEHLVPPAALTLARHPAWSTDWKLFQRDAAGQATIPVRFLYRLAGPGQVRARVVHSATRFVVPGHDFAAHVVALAPGDGAAGQIDVDRVPAGGNYDVELELVADSDPGTALASGFLASVAVGDVWIAGGQSNMSGYSGGLAGAELPIDEVHLFHNDYTWKRAREPMDDGSDQKDRVGAESPGHSLLLRFAKELYRATGVPQAVIPGPLGGTNLYAQWQRDPAEHFHRGTLYGSLLHRVRLQGYATPPRGFLWFQGESDALAPRSTAQYRQDLETLAAQVREDTGNPRLYFLNAQLGTFSGAPLAEWLAVQEAERQAAAADPDMGLIPCVDVTRSDAIHYDVPGYKLIGVRFAELAREEVFGEAIDAQAELLALSRGGGGDKVLLDYDAPVSGGVPALYEVRDGAGVAPVAAASAAGNRVTLDLTRALSGAASVTYGLSVDPAAPWVKGPRGNAVACFKDLDLP